MARQAGGGEGGLQVLVRGLGGATAVVAASAAAPVASLKAALHARAGVPASSQGLVYGGRQLEDGRSLGSYGVQHGATVHLVLRLRGGKGGFGALLRGAGRAALTDNFDACRDLSGRRLRHVNADRKLAEWAAQARERELEKLAAQHIREQQRLARREAKAQVDIDDVRTEQAAALANVSDAVVSGLKRGLPESAGAPGPKRSRFQSAFHDEEASSGSEVKSDDDRDVDDDDVSQASGAVDDQPAMHDSPEPAHSVPESRVAVIASVEGSKSSGSEQEHVDVLVAPVADAESLTRLPSSGSTLKGATSLLESHGSTLALPTVSAMGEASLTRMESAATVEPTAASVASTPAGPSTSKAVAVAASADVGGVSPQEMIKPSVLQKYSCAEELEAFGLDYLKIALQAAGLKAGGSLAERAARLFLLRDMPLTDIPRKHLAKPEKK